MSALPTKRASRGRAFPQSTEAHQAGSPNMARFFPPDFPERDFRPDVRTGDHVRMTAFADEMAARLPAPFVLPEPCPARLADVSPTRIDVALVLDIRGDVQGRVQ